MLRAHAPLPEACPAENLIIGMGFHKPPPWTDLKHLLGLTVKTYMQAWGMNQQELAHLSGVSHSHISRLINGDGVAVSCIEKLVKALHVRVSWILDEATPERLAEIFAVQVLLAAREAKVDKPAVLYLVQSMARESLQRKAG